jgi:uncharacterized protein (TIGR02722 family)
VTLVLLSVGCKSVTRQESDEVIDLSGNWNDIDSQSVAEEMIQDSLVRPWVTNHQAKTSKRPIVMVGGVRNNTSEHINTETFTKELERAFVNSGKIRMVANAINRPELRDEVLQMQTNATKDTAKKLRQETGADYMLVGVVNDINDKEGGKTVRFYQINLELIHLQTHEKVWIGQKKIKKLVKKSKFGF